MLGCIWRRKTLLDLIGLGDLLELGDHLGVLVDGQFPVARGILAPRVAVENFYLESHELRPFDELGVFLFSVRLLSHEAHVAPSG